MREIISIQLNTPKGDATFIIPDNEEVYINVTFTDGTREEIAMKLSKEGKLVFEGDEEE